MTEKFAPIMDMQPPIHASRLTGSRIADEPQRRMGMIARAIMHLSELDMGFGNAIDGLEAIATDKIGAVVNGGDAGPEKNPRPSGEMHDLSEIIERLERRYARLCAVVERLQEL